MVRLDDTRAKRVFWIALALLGLALVFIFQHLDVICLLCRCKLHPFTHFVARKFVRVMLNDSLMLLIIHCWFYDRSITRLALYVQLIDTFVLLPMYFILKLTLEGDSEISMPLLSQLHRLIVNPTLMVLIIPGVYYQRLIHPKAA